MRDLTDDTAFIGVSIFFRGKPDVEEIERANLSRFHGHL